MYISVGRGPVNQYVECGLAFGTYLSLGASNLEMAFALRILDMAKRRVPSFSFTFVTFVKVI